jgi:outer membrane protein OmpA-like peptidoglycan-associated protein
MSRAATDLPVEAAPANFDIFVLGTRSSGKSVLLASLYRQLSSMDGVTNFFARCDDPDQHKELCDNYDQLLDTEADWPAGTFRVDSYDMRCFHRLRGKSLPVFSIRFHDYPGGYVSNQVERRDFVEERAASCNSVMALIDGRKLLDRLEDREDNPAHSLHKDLDSLVRVLQQCIGKPIHFVLTKADLLAPVKYPLKDIIAELRRHKGFSDILAQQIEADATCYLVPVSAIGPGFAVIDPADGIIKKRRNGTIDPFHLEVMTSVSMVDTVLDLARNVESVPPETDGGKGSLMLRVRKLMGKKLTYARLMVPAAVPLFGHLGVLGIMALSIGAENYIADHGRSFEDKVREIRGTISDRASAIEAILKIQYQLLDRFLKRFPAARLGARFDPVTKFAPYEDRVKDELAAAATIAAVDRDAEPEPEPAPVPVPAPDPTPTPLPTPVPVPVPEAVPVPVPPLPKPRPRVAVSPTKKSASKDTTVPVTGLFRLQVAGAFALAALIAIGLLAAGPAQGRSAASGLRLLVFALALASARFMTVMAANARGAPQKQKPPARAQLWPELRGWLVTAPILLGVSALAIGTTLVGIFFPLLLLFAFLGDRKWSAVTSGDPWVHRAGLAIVCASCFIIWANANAVFSATNQQWAVLALMLNCTVLLAPQNRSAGAKLSPQTTLASGAVVGVVAVFLLVSLWVTRSANLAAPLPLADTGSSAAASDAAAAIATTVPKPSPSATATAEPGPSPTPTQTPMPVALSANCRPGPYIVNFDFDKSDITPEAGGVLENAALFFANCGNARVRLTWFESWEDTPGIGRRRAAAVASYLPFMGFGTTAISARPGRRHVQAASGVRDPEDRRVEILFVPGTSR